MKPTIADVFVPWRYLAQGCAHLTLQRLRVCAAGPSQACGSADMRLHLEVLYHCLNGLYITQVCDGKPYVLGLTGSIAMGKTTIAAMFTDLGIPVLDSDATVHQLYQQGGAAVPVIQEMFPDAIKEGLCARPLLLKLDRWSHKWCTMTYVYKHITVHHLTTARGRKSFGN